MLIHYRTVANVRCALAPVLCSWRIGALAAGALLSVCGTVMPRPALAQESVLIAPNVPDDYDRGRNTSVTQRARPSYDPIGINMGGFRLDPRLEVGVGASDNVYLNNTNTISDGLVDIKPSLDATSNWSRHYARLSASGDIRRYFNETPRNQNAVNLGGLGRLDFGSNYAVTGEAQYAKQYESPLSGEIDPTLATISSYQRGFVSLRGERREGRTRLRATVDRTAFGFSPIVRDTLRIDQRNRDRAIVRASGQAEYALSPSLAVYGEYTHDWTDYRTELAPGVANRDSEGDRVIGGVNFDLAGVARGAIGVGYTRRNYNSPIYKDVDGVSVEAQVEYFLSQLTTITLNGRRIIADSSIGSSTAFFDNRVSLRVDHELLRNLLLNASAEVGYIDYIGINSHSTIFRASGGGRYLINRRFALGGTVNYTTRTSAGTGTGNQFNEFAGLISFIIQR